MRPKTEERRGEERRERKEGALTLVVQVLEHDEGGLLRADRVPQAVASDDQEVLAALERGRLDVRLGGHVRLVRGVA